MVAAARVFATPTSAATTSNQQTTSLSGLRGFFYFYDKAGLHKCEGRFMIGLFKQGSLCHN